MDQETVYSNARGDFSDRSVCSDFSDLLSESELEFSHRHKPKSSCSSCTQVCETDLTPARPLSRSSTEIAMHNSLALSASQSCKSIAADLQEAPGKGAIEVSPGGVNASDMSPGMTKSPAGSMVFTPDLLMASKSFGRAVKLEVESQLEDLLVCLGQEEQKVHILSQALLALGKDATLLLKEHGLDDQSLDNLLVADENLLTDGVENEPEECVGSLTAPSRNSAHPACLAENLEPRLLMSAGQSPEEVGFDILGTEEFSSNGDSDSAKSPAKKKSTPRTTRARRALGELDANLLANMHNEDKKSGNSKINQNTQDVVECEHTDGLVSECTTKKGVADIASFDEAQAFYMHAGNGSKADLCVGGLESFPLQESSSSSGSNEKTTGEDSVKHKRRSGGRPPALAYLGWVLLGISKMAPEIQKGLQRT
mmetsp:Transcript_10654/g.20158  ORF Transcript_10654/g.20158 Transcript_10654/m.20158 type:complete len:425 (-) Transcript_10654:388-1662(-)